MSADLRRRAGMTLIELMIAMVVFGIVISVALVFMSQQNAAYQQSLQRLIALRNLRYAATTLRQDLETLGTNVPVGQPAFLYGDDGVVVFAADHTTNLVDDPFAVFADPDAPTGQVVAPSGGFPYPNALVGFPDTVYETSPGARSPAEIIQFWFAPDTATDRTDDYRLYRRVNTGPAEVVARNLLHLGAAPFFEYLRVGTGAGGGRLEPVGDSLLPIHHAQSLHGAPGDTALSALADQVRAVRLRIVASDGEPGDRESTVQLTRLIALPNAGEEALTVCGSRPILGSSLTATAGLLSTGTPGVTLSWDAATDEDGGESDVVRYVIWRRVFGFGDWGEPYVAIAAGNPTYSWEDAAGQAGMSYEYALAAQDCTPSLSPLTTAGPVVFP